MSTTYTMQFDEDRFDADAVILEIEMGDGTVVSEQDIIDEVAEAATLAQLDEIGEFVRSTGFAASQAIAVAIRKQDVRIVQLMQEYGLALVRGRAKRLVFNPRHYRKSIDEGWTFVPEVQQQSLRARGVA